MTDTSSPQEQGSSLNQLNRLIDIGIALSAELDLDRLLEKIVQYTRELTHADAGTLYLLIQGKLHFKIIQNDSLGISKGGTGSYINLPPVELDKTNVSAYTAITGETVNIDDVYESEDFDFTGPRKYDATTGYRSRSMLVVPMKNHKGECIGVLQLLNATDPSSGTIIPFPPEIVDCVRALTSQAAVSITNATLIKETKDLFESLIKVLAVSVDAKSHYTGNHVQRVAELNVWLARAVNETGTGPLKDIHFSEKEMEEIRLAGWLHDVGKIVTPVWVMDKSVKLESIVDRIGLLKLRFELIKSLSAIHAYRKKTEILESGGDTDKECRRIDADLEHELQESDDMFRFIEECNQPNQFMEDEKIEKLSKIAERTYTLNGEEHPYLTQDELHNLQTRKGSLTREQMDIMRDHVVWTGKMLNEIPFKGPLKHVPLFAAQHHEKINGTGYPGGISDSDIPIQSRILAISDFYEALSAKDRPYKKPMPEEKIISILTSAAEHGEIDKDILDTMIEQKIHTRFEQEYEHRRADRKK